ncbi:MAG: phenylalanine--tRNA ligase subunit alpha, partial [Patescibacteria group bacterium]
MQIDFQKIKDEAEKELEKISSALELENLRVKYFGRKDGVLTNILKSLKDLDDAQKRIIGSRANDIKQYLEEAIGGKLKQLKESQAEFSQAREKIDVTAPGVKVPRGHSHPLSALIEKVCSIFSNMGFEIASGPEVETEYYNFDALNIPKDHPARDMQDTFWLQDDQNVSSPKLLLRTQTSNVQIRYMEENKPPFRIVSPGRVFRNEATDATHETQFYQFEGLMIGRNISLANLKGVLELFFRRLLDDEKIKIRFRPSYFPFVEPGVEVDMTCFKCNPRTQRAEQSPYDGNPRT